MALVKVRNDADDGWIEIGGQVSILQSDEEPGSTFPGMLWLDTNAVGEGSQVIRIQDGDGDTMVQCEESGDEDIVRIDAGGNEIWIGTADGYINKPLLPAFKYGTSGVQTNIPQNTWTPIEFDTVVFDQGNDFDTDNNLFTAPVTGRYLLSFSVRVEDVDATANYFIMELNISNGNHPIGMDIPGADDPSFIAVSTSLIVDMDANDVAQVKFYQSGGVAQVDITASTNWNSFCGLLVA
jgi:hypothetical protein